jgi:hypothetical protein
VVVAAVVVVVVVVTEEETRVWWCGGGIVHVCVSNGVWVRGSGGLTRRRECSRQGSLCSP